LGEERAGPPAQWAVVEEPRAAAVEERPEQQAVAAEPLAGAELAVELQGAAAGEAQVGPRAEEGELPAGVEQVEEPWGAVAEEARAGPRAEEARAVEARLAPVREASLPVGAPRAVVTRNIRRICFLEGRTCGTSGTLLGAQPLVQPGREQPAGAAARAPVAFPRVAVFHSAHTWAHWRGSCFRRMRSACNVRFLVRSRQRSYPLLISILVGLTRRWLLSKWG
jgi:hypothetical protein